MYQEFRNDQLYKCIESTPRGTKKFLLFRVLKSLKYLQDPLKYLQEQEGSSLVHLCEQEPPRERDAFLEGRSSKATYLLLHNLKVIYYLTVTFWDCLPSWAPPNQSQYQIKWALLPIKSAHAIIFYSNPLTTPLASRMRTHMKRTALSVFELNTAMGFSWTRITHTAWEYFKIQLNKRNYPGKMQNTMLSSSVRNPGFCVVKVW